MSTQRTGVVTGGARGIGAGIVRRLAADGHQVAIFDRDGDGATELAESLAHSGGRVAAYAVDVADEAAVTHAVREVAETLGPPTIVVNNAGITRDALLFKMTVDDWDAVMNVHLRGAFLMSRATQQYMTEAAFGRIVNISSTGALGNRGQVNYSAAKAGIQGFTKTLAIELGRFGVTANAVGPGFIETEMTHAAAAGMGMTFDQLKEIGEKQIAVSRIGHPSDVAAITSFLVSEEAGFISGQVVYVAGGPVG